MAEGKTLKLANSLGLPRTPAGIEVDSKGRTATQGLYAVGRSTSIARSQAIISAGAGAIAAIDILSKEAGKDIRDYDEVS
jgi:thioredoxin reductase (NADPH)